MPTLHTCVPTKKKNNNIQHGPRHLTSELEYNRFNILDWNHNPFSDHTITNSTFHTGILWRYFKTLHYPYSKLKFQNPKGLTLLADVRFLDNWYRVSFPQVSRWGLVLTTHPFSALVVHGYRYTSTSLCSHCMLQDDLDLNCQCYNNLSHKKHTLVLEG